MASADVQLSMHIVEGGLKPPVLFPIIALLLVACAHGVDGISDIGGTGGLQSVVGSSGGIGGVNSTVVGGSFGASSGASALGGSGTTIVNSGGGNVSGGSSAAGTNANGGTSVGTTGGSTASQSTGNAASGGSGAGGSIAVGTSAPSPFSFVVQPTFVGNSNSAVPQAGILSLQTNVKATVVATVSGGDETWTLTLPEGTRFETPVVGLKPATTYSIDLAVSSGSATLDAGPLQWTSPALPSNFPPISLATSEPSQMEPGMTLFNIRVGWSGDPAPGVIVDAQGVVRWYYQGDAVHEDFRRLSNGNFLFATEECLLEEIDILGNTVRSWVAANYPASCPAPSDAIPVAADSFHHETSMLPNGNLLVLSSELRSVDDFPTSDTNPDAPRSTTPVITCVVVEFQPDGTILKYIPIIDLLDPMRIGRGTFEDQWSMNTLYDKPNAKAADWDHANAVVYDENSDSYLVSLRHQDAIIKVNRTTETLTWILGTPSNWQQPWSLKLLAPSEDDFTWHYHQHAIDLTPDGKLIMYDNGNFRAAAFETTQSQWSRALVLEVDESNNTVSQIWSYGDASGANSVYSSALGDADWMPTTGNVLLVNSQLMTMGGAHAEIAEVTSNGTRVFELDVRGSSNNSVYTVYRADRIADIRQ